MAEREPLISIICAIRNEDRFIRETLDTVVSQSYLNWELVIMDGGSTDKTLSILQEYEGIYKNIIVYSESDSGQWHALDKALALSKGEYVTMLCGQDGYLDKEWLKRCVEVFNNDKDISLVWGVPINMSEDGKLLGPHYAYARFLKDDKYGSQTKPISTIMAKIDWSRDSAMKRFWQLLRKLTWSRMRIVFLSFIKEDIPQKEDWLEYWIRTNRVFPEGNMVVDKKVFLKHTKRFPEEKMANAALLDFCFNFNVNGLLSYGLSLAASFGRSHVEGQDLREHDTELTRNYYEKVSEFRKKIIGKPFAFFDSMGRVVSERVIKI